MKNEIASLLFQTIEKNKEKYIKTLVDVVKIDTHDIDHGIGGGLEKHGQEYLRKLFIEMGADVIADDPIKEEILLKSKEIYNEGNLGHNNVDRSNLYATFHGGGPSLLFNGHIDTMPVNSPDKWTVDPHGGVIKDGKLYGVGACDMKAGLVASIMAVKAIKDAGLVLPGTVKFASVCDEEGGGNGSLVAAMNGVQADAVVVCEPTDYELIAAHMGWVFFEVEITGYAVHSGLKIKGVNAIEKMIKVINALNEMEHKWLLNYKHMLLPPPSLNIGVIKGGSAGSTVPDRCIVQICVHYQPGMSHDLVVADVTETISLCSEGDDWLREHRPRISIYQNGNPFEMDLTNPFVKTFKQSFEEATGDLIQVVGSPAGCDSRTWRTIAKCPTLQYGPGRLAQCHAVDEYVDIEQYIDAIKIYATLIMNWGEKEA